MQKSVVDSLGLPRFEPALEEINSLQAELHQKFEAINKEFVAFRAYAHTVLADVRQRLSSGADVDPVTLQSDLVEMSSISYTLGQTVADAKLFQQVYEMIHYYPKKQQYSEADRKLYTQTKAIHQTHLVKQLAAAEDRLEKRITVYQSLLKAETARYTRGDSE